MSRRAARLSPRDQDTEETRLQEQVRLLTLENETLRNFIAEKGFTGAPPSKLLNGNKEPKKRRGSIPNMPTDPGTPRSGARGCSCKGNCSTRVCGCVKKNVPCAEFCRCGDELCQNSEPDKENIGDPNNQPELSKDAADSLAKLSKLTLTENKGNKLNHPALEPINKHLEEVVKPRSLFSPDIADNVFQFEKTGDIDFENISLRFGDDKEAEPAEAAGKTGASGEAKSAPGKKSKKDEKKNKDAAAGSAAQDKKGKSKKGRVTSVSDDEKDVDTVESEVAEKTGGKKGNKKTETKKGKAEVAPVKGNKKQASKTRARVNSESENDDNTESGEEDEAVAPVKAKKKQTSKTRARVNKSESENEDKTESEEDEETVTQEPIKEKSREKINNKKETKKGKTSPAQSDQRQATKGRSRIQDNNSESEDEDNTDNERESEEAIEAHVEEKANEGKNIAKKGKQSAAPEKNIKIKGGRARIRSSSSEFKDLDQMETDEDEQEAEQDNTASNKNYKKIKVNREESSEDSEDDDDDDDDFVEPEPINKKNSKEGTKGKKLTTVEEQHDDEESDELSEDSDENVQQDPREKNNNNATAGASAERMEDDEESEQSEYSITSSKASNTLSPSAADGFNPMKPRRQLMRSPLAPKTGEHVRPPQDPSEIPLRVPVKEELPETPPAPEELNKDVIENWEQHKANLVECRKCGRKLYPYRIQKHEASCQKI